ncbi:MAG: undecaprenyl-diphosphate phosphatase [Nitrospirae bacterium]|nr:MAG: undecaprenyl-diphosphate phosphatase [Nitrospirota bacterium]
MNEWGPELAVLLGVVEGLTEFLPVSSTGHLILVGHVLGFTGAVASSVEISIQLGSILAIVAYERTKLVSLLSQAIREQATLRELIRTGRHEARGAVGERWSSIFRRSADTQRNLWFLIGLGVAFMPAAIIGYIAHGWIETHLFTPHTVAASLIIGGLIILGVEAMPDRVRITRLDHIGVMTALLVGLTQCVSLIPGISRSGSTIVGGLLAGMDRKTATEYSFFLALPTMIAATTYQILKADALLTNADYAWLALGLLVSFLVAWVVIAAFLTFVKRHTLQVFAYYRVLLGLVVLWVVR